MSVFHHHPQKELAMKDPLTRGPLPTVVEVGRMRANFLLLLAVLCLPALVLAQGASEEPDKDPFASVEEALTLRGTMSVREIKEFIKTRINDPKAETAIGSFLIAELMKQVGDYRAQDYYEKAIQKDDDQPAYELFYADYLRNFRGAQRPLFPEAERHYFAAMRKQALAEKRKPANPKTDEQLAFHYKMVRERIDRGLVTLYQEDGLPLFSYKSQGGSPNEPVAKPAAFLSSINRFARSTADLDEVHDTRDFTSEALFASSPARLNRPLSIGELRGIVRLKQPAATFERLRFRHDDWPVIDVFYQRRVIQDAQVTNFFEPNKFNDVSLHNFGVAVEKSLNVAPYFDVNLRGAYSRIERKGVIEFLPLRNEGINQFEGKAAVSRFFGPDKADLEFTYAFQEINPDIPNPPTRDRRIVGVTAGYQILRHLPFLKDPYGQRFATRGLHLFGGIAQDKERFGSVDVRRRDYFVGTSVNGLGPFDITFQPTFFKSRVSADSSQTNSQFRTDLTVLLRVQDEEKVPGIPHRKVLGLYPAFVNLIFPFKKDVAIDGLKAFENYKLGVGLNMKFFRGGLGSSGSPLDLTRHFTGTTFLVSLRYDHQRFHRLDKSANLFSLSVSMGF